METSGKIGELIDLVDELELYGRERQVVKLLLQEDFAGAFTLCHEVRCREYELIAGVPPGLTATYRKNLQALEQLKACLAELHLLQYTSPRREAHAV